MNLDFYEVILDISVNRHYANRYVKMMRHYQSLRLKKGERHHVLPRSLFPDYKYKRGNIVCLPYRVHFIAHMLLWLATRHEKMAMALSMMGNFRFKSRSYERYRTRIVAQIGKNARVGGGSITQSLAKRFLFTQRMCLVGLSLGRVNL